MSTCDIVAERIALGEPLGEHAEHATTCERCRQLVAMTAQLGATHHAIDPGLGFSSRMTVGAQQLITLRRRRRVVAVTGASLAAAALAVFVLTRPPERKQEPAIASTPPVEDQPVALDEGEARWLLEIADPAAAHTTADWRRVTEPVRPYKKLLKGITP